MQTISRRTALGLAATAALTGCTRTCHEAGRISFWALGTLGENIPLLLPAFERDSGISVAMQAIPWTGAHEKLLTSFAGRSLPDVMMVDNAWLPELALLAAITALPPGSPMLADQLPSARASVSVDGRSMAVPWTADSWVQFYRRDLLAEVGYPTPPLFWEEWSRMARAIKRRHPERYATLHLLDWPEPLLGFAAQQSEPLLRDRNTRGNFSSPGFRAALAYYKSIYDAGFSPKVTGSEAGDNYLNFRSGWFAILPSTAVSIGDLRRRQGMIPRSLWGAVATPGERGAGIGMARGTSLAVSRQCRDPAAAQRLVDYLASAATQQQIYGITGDLPTRPAAWAAAGLGNDTTAQVFAQQIERSVTPPSVPEWQRIVSEMQLVAEHMVRGEFGVAAAAQKMDSRVDRILEKRRWLLDHGRLT